MKYLIYLRVSSEQQEKSGWGMKAQETMCMNYIEKKGGSYEFKIYPDKGISGSLPYHRRPQLDLAIREIRKGDTLLIAKRDRIGRDPIINATIDDLIRRKKAFMVSASGDVNCDNETSSVLLKGILDVISKNERLIIGDRTRAALQVKKKNGQRVGCIPYGYCLHELDKTILVKDELEQKNIEIIKKMQGDGLSLRAIAHELTDLGILNRKGKSWHNVSIFRILKNNKD